MSEQRQMTWSELADENAHLRAVNKELREALEPFANITVPDFANDGTWVAETKYCNNMVTAISVRRARAALAEVPA